MFLTGNTCVGELPALVQFQTADCLPAGTLAVLSAAIDDLRALGEPDLRLDHGILRSRAKPNALIRKDLADGEGFELPQEMPGILEFLLKAAQNPAHLAHKVAQSTPNCGQSLTHGRPCPTPSRPAS